MSNDAHDLGVRGPVGVVGLGAMGWPIAQHLRTAGVDVVVTDANPAARDRARAEGLTVVDSAAELATRVDACIASLPTGAIVRQVTDELWSVRPDLLVCDTSTIDPATARELAARGPHLDTPILGRPAGVGSWTIPVGGADDLAARAEVLLAPLARRVVRVGDAGAAAVLKVCNNLMLSAINAVTGEALALAEASGLDPQTFVDVVLDSGAASVSGLFRDVAPRAVAGDFDPVFSLALMRKDAQLALDLAAAQGTPLEVVAASQRVNDAAIESGLGAEDSIAVVKSIRAGR
ncbi:NAD(P)-dependent oxidoreductase [Aestuariimicrobium soli]|uniref:NAD(P)-dependent oxidoreductase n=1 Tax=Aestuariimicrobium soli TaxID=2035834 RepID=UPI003EBB62BF